MHNNNIPTNIIIMNVIIPLGGKGERFAKLGYKMPKPLIRVMGHEIILWLIDSLDHTLIDTLCIPYHETLSDYRFESFIQQKYPKLNTKFLKLANQTKGAAESVLLASKLVTNDKPIICIDGDNFYTCNILERYAASKIKNCVFCFYDNSTEAAIYSYTKTDNDLITDIAEKERISNMANAGIYCFESKQILQKYCSQIIDNNISQKGEYYISGAIKQLITDLPASVINIRNEEYVCLGTPLQVRLFCNNFPRINAVTNQTLIKPKRICFDLDNTLVTYPRIFGDYTTVEPIINNIKIVQYLKKLGNTIIIYTARRMKTHSSNVGKVVANIGKITFDTLDKFDIPYDEIYFGKPYADYYIDDLAISPYSDLEKELGFYESKIDPRSFNSLQEKSIQIYRKESVNLDGEIHWYLNTPGNIKDMFPTLISYDMRHYRWYDMDKLDAISVSKLYLSEQLTTEMLNHIIGSINRIHTSAKPTDAINIYENYCDKMKRRYESYNYSKYDCSEIYNKIYAHMHLYETEARGSVSVIHGDTVLTNIMINVHGKIKFIDMRGKIGNTLTIFGDKFYDWAKLYQSIIGYDEILESKQINLKYKQKFIDELESYFIKTYGECALADIKYIAASLLFSLIPLHDDDKCGKYYELCCKLISA